MNILLKTILAIFLILPIYIPKTYATWSNDTTVNSEISTAAGDQYNPAIISDGSGGAIIIWVDGRNGDYDIYAQRINASGDVLWTPDGVPVCTAAYDQYNPTIVSDGSGGAIITWYDYRSGDYDIYAQKINSSGDVQWPEDGVPICTVAYDQYYPTIASDGSGGAIISWADARNGNYDIYAQKINTNGDVQWTADGVPICIAAGSQIYPTIVSDGSGGAIITWHDSRSGDYDVYAQKINSSGDVQWTADGVPICMAAYDQYYPTIASDGSGGAIISWRDYRNGDYDIYAQRINTDGDVQWTADGEPISTALYDQYYPIIVSDGSGGAIITWYDSRNGNTDIYAQRINSSGDVQWTSDGVPICMATSSQYSPTIASDVSGESIITWYDSRNGNTDIYAQKINASGDIQWTENGVSICTATASQYNPAIVSDGNGGAIITWRDSRNGNADIYAQRIDASGIFDSTTSTTSTTTTTTTSPTTTTTTTTSTTSTTTTTTSPTTTTTTTTSTISTTSTTVTVTSTTTTTTISTTTTSPTTTTTTTTSTISTTSTTVTVTSTTTTTTISTTTSPTTTTTTTTSTISTTNTTVTATSTTTISQTNTTTIMTSTTSTTTITVTSTTTTLISTTTTTIPVNYIDLKARVVKFPKQIKRGNRANIIAKVKNIGNENALNFNVSFYLSTNSNKSIDEGDVAIGAKSLLGIKKNKIKTVVYRYRVSKETTKGVYHIKVIFNGESSVTESNKNNNIGVSKRIRIK